MITESSPAGVISELRAAGAADKLEPWPRNCIQIMDRHGAWGGVVPKKLGGQELSQAALLSQYRNIASGDLCSALILTQHDGACQFFLRSPNRSFAENRLQLLASGRELASIGISHLTTSSRANSLRASMKDGSIVLDGLVPWVTSADHAQWVVVGAGLESGEQILVAVNPASEQVQVREPFPLLALQSSSTSAIHFNSLQVPDSQLLLGPANPVLASRSAVKSMTVSAVAMGHCDHIMDALSTLNASLLPEMAKVWPSVLEKWTDLNAHFAELVQNLETASSSEKTAFRARVNAFVARLSSSLTILCKGRGFLNDFPHSRLIREAVFFQVWSAPEEVRARTLQNLWNSQPPNLSSDTHNLS